MTIKKYFFLFILLCQILKTKTTEIENNNQTDKTDINYIMRHNQPYSFSLSKTVLKEEKIHKLNLSSYSS